jgi:hypothetical protein
LDTATEAEGVKALSRASPGGLAETVACLVGIVALALFQWPALSGATRLGHDHLYWGVPIYGFFAEAVGQGRLPLWNPFTHGGEPAYIPLFQLRLLDPTAVLVAAIGRWLGGDPETLYAWDRFVRSVVIASGLYLTLRLWARHLLTRLSLIPIVLFSSVQWAPVRQMAVADQFLLAPFVLLFLLRIVYLRDNRWRNWLAAAFLVSLNFQSYFFSGTLTLLVFLAIGLLLFRPEMLRRMRSLPGLRARLVAAAAVLSVMLLPSIVLLSDTSRFVFPPRVVDYPYEDAPPNQGPPQHEPRGEIRASRPMLFPYRLQLHMGTYSAPVDFVQLWAPFASEFARPSRPNWGKPSEAFMYIGMMPLALALLGLVAGRDVLRRVWLFVLVSLGLLLLGPQGFLHGLLYWVFPPLWFARNMHSLVLFFVLGLLYFYVLGCNLVLRGRPSLPFSERASGPLARGTGSPVWARILAMLLLTFGTSITVVTLSRVRYPLTFYTLPALACLGVVGWWLRGDLGARGLYGAVLVGWTGTVVLLAVRARDLTSVFFLALFFAIPVLIWSSWNSCSRRAARLGAGLAGAALMAVLTHRLVVVARSSELSLSPGLVLALGGAVAVGIALSLVVRDLWRPGPRVLSRGSLAAWLGVIATFDLVAYSGYLRPLVEGPRPQIQSATMRDSVQLPSRVVAVSGGPDTFEQPIRYVDLMTRTASAFSPAMPAPSSRWTSEDPAAEIDYLLQRERASTFLMPRGYTDLIGSGAAGATLAHVFAIGQPVLQVRREWVWRARSEGRRMLRDASWAGETSVVMRRSVILDPEGRAIEDVPESRPTGADGRPWRWNVRRYDYNSLELDVEAPTRGVLYWADGYDPHWRAWVDTVEVPVLRANLAFKAVFVPAGRHAVRFEYRPTAIVVTGLLFVALGGAGAGLAVWALASPPRVPRFARRG